MKIKQLISEIKVDKPISRKDILATLREKPHIFNTLVQNETIEDYLQTYVGMYDVGSNNLESVHNLLSLGWGEDDKFLAEIVIKYYQLVSKDIFRVSNYNEPIPIPQYSFLEIIEDDDNLTNIILHNIG